MPGIATRKNRIQLYMENICVYPDPNERQAILAYLGPGIETQRLLAPLQELVADDYLEPQPPLEPQ